MEYPVETAWLKPPQQIGGLDHLGVQAPCIQIYSQLLPGITNVTDRARYYSFYPWLLSQFEKQAWRSESEVLLMLRRAECLLTLISLQHDHDSDDGTENHRAAMVGSEALSHAVTVVNAGGTVTISTYSDVNATAHRYFKNPVGGLGQYYFGTLWGLGLLDGDSPRAMRLPKGTGTKMAEIVEHYVPTDKFIEILKLDSVNKDNLVSLRGFCPCSLSDAKEEAEALIGIMLQGWTVLNPDEVASEDVRHASTSRSHSLAYLCLLADTAYESATTFDVHSFRAMIYTISNATNKELSFPESLSSTVSGWQVYQRNELLSVALQGLFFSLLTMADDNTVRFNNSEELCHWCWHDAMGAEVIDFLSSSELTTTNWFTEISKQLPKFTDWQHDSHEIQCMSRVNQITNKKGINKEELRTVIKDSLVILASILCRPENSMGYGDIDFPEGYLSYYPVNLNSVFDDFTQHLSDFNIKESLSIFTQNRCLDAHLRVAMRKLQQQGKNTFRFEPSELGLIIKSIPRATNTSPRFGQALRIITDLGLLSRESGLLKTTNRGKLFVEAAV
jgi:hypothetical protein